MTTGRINQVTITLGMAPRIHTTRLSHICVYARVLPVAVKRAAQPNARISFPNVRVCFLKLKHFVFVSEMRPRIVPNSRGAPVGQASF